MSFTNKFNMASNFNIYIHKINFEAKYGTNSAVPTVRIYGIKFPT